jgi:HK97 family phage prohead protease
MTTTMKRSQLRETRSLNVHDLQMRSNDDGSLTFSGYASMTGVPYAVNDLLGEYQETIARGAFTKALQENDDVRLLVNHDGIPLARTKSGTLVLSEDENGLRCEAQLDQSSPLVQTIRSAMRRGDLDQMSFAFAVVRQEWSQDYTQRTINECRLFDVSVVTYPASPSTTADLRSAVVRSVAAGVSTGRVDEILLELRAGRALSAANVALLEQVLSSIRDAAETIDEANESIEEASSVLAELVVAAGGNVEPEPEETPTEDAPMDQMPMEDAPMVEASRGIDLSLARAKARRI